MRSIFLAGSFFVATMAVTGCAQKQMVSYPPFPAGEYAKLERTGTSTVTGQAFLRTQGGDIKTGAGNEIQLIPATTYSAVFYNAYKTQSPASDPDPQVKQYTFRTQADASGGFEFKNIPKGRYYLVGNVIWMAPGPYGLSKQGGLIIKEVNVSEGAQAKIMLTW